MGTRGPKPLPVDKRLNRHREITPEGCWSWTGPINNCGYGHVSFSDGVGPRRCRLVHRLSYEFYRGHIADGLVLDHLCRNRRCFNPDHLEEVTPRENLMRSPIAPAAVNARKTHCPQGHEYTPDNIYVNRKTGRLCKTCQLNRRQSRETSAVASIHHAGFPDAEVGAK